MAEKSLVNDVAVMLEPPAVVGAVEAPVVVAVALDDELDDLDELLQAARPMVTTTAAESAAVRRAGLTIQVPPWVLAALGSVAT